MVATAIHKSMEGAVGSIHQFSITAITKLT